MKFYNYRNRTFKQKYADSLVLSDSLGRNIRYIHRTDTFFFPGCTIGALAHKIRSGEVNIKKYTYITLIIGSNDLGPKSSWKFFKREKKLGHSGFNLPIHSQTPIPVLLSAYQNLVAVIRKYNPKCTLICFAILPRPFDHHRNKQHHTDTNKQLLKLCDKNNLIFVKSWNSYLKFGKPVSELFSDGLHLSVKGNRQLNKLISNTVNSHRSMVNRSRKIWDIARSDRA